jgi:hypothetical protein
MFLIKRLLLMVLCLSLAAGGFYVAALRTARSDNLAGWQKSLESLLAGISAPQVQKQISSLQRQSTVLSDRANDVSMHTSKILGEAIEANPDAEVPISQRAFEYGRYLYCQEVVKAYEEAEQKK